MYLCYVDESGDAGKYDEKRPESSGSRYFILTGMFVEVKEWKATLDIIKNFRRQLAAQAYLNYDVEFHCAELIDPRKDTPFKQLSVNDRWKILRMFAALIGKQTSCKIIAIVIDKRASDLLPGNYQTGAITNLYQAFNEFLQLQRSQGVVLFDKTNEKPITSHVRQLTGSGLTGQRPPGRKIDRIIEDPIYRVSADSLYIQATDVIAYSLKEQEFPNASRKKFNADRIFKYELAENCLRSSFSGEDGIIRP